MHPQIRRVAQRATLYSQLRQELFDEWLRERLGTNDFAVDPGQNLFAFESRDGDPDAPVITTRPFLLATIAMEPATVLWGFAQFHERSTGPNAAARGIRRFGTDHELEAFSQEETPYEHSGENQPAELNLFSHDLGQAAVEIFGPDILYSSVPNGGDGSRAVYLHTELSEPAPKPTYSQVLSRLPRLVSSCDDAAWSLAGLARLLGWQFEELAEPDSWLLHHAPGETMRVSVYYDDAGRITDVRVSG